SYTSHTHPTLHSFPTRRSSDLRPSAHQVTTRVAEIDHPGHREKCSPPIATTREGPCCFPSDVRLRRRRAPRWPPPCSPRSPTHRSEEHTSELQSRENLVCRLLL